MFPSLLHFPMNINWKITTLLMAAGNPEHVFPATLLWDEVDAPWDLIVTVLSTETIMLEISDVHWELSISNISLTYSPGIYPSFSKWKFMAHGPLLQQQQYVISLVCSFFWVSIALVSLKVIYLANFNWNCGLYGSTIAVKW